MKRRKLEQDDVAPKQVDAHIRAFLQAVISNAKKSKRLSGTKSNGVSVLEVASTKNRRKVPSHDMSTQTEEDAFIETSTPPREPHQSPTAILSQNAAAYYAAAASAAVGPSNTDLEYYADSSSNASSGDVRQLVSDWMQQYEDWFFQNFGVDVRSVSAAPIHSLENPPTPPHPVITLPSNVKIEELPAPLSGFVPPTSPPSSAVHPLDEDITVACQTPYQIRQAPVMYPTVVPTMTPVYIPLEATLTALFSQQIATQNLLSSFLVSRQQQNMAAAIAAAMAARNVADRVVPPPPAPPSFPDMSPTADEPPEVDASLLESPEMSGPVTQYGAYGILKQCTRGLDLDNDLVASEKEEEATGASEAVDCSANELPVFITPEEYRNQPKSWMPPPPPTVMLLRKQAMICVLQSHIRNKAHEIWVRKSTTKCPVEIDYVAALESTVEKSVKTRVTYVFNRINRLPAEAQSPFLCGLKHADLLLERSTSYKPATAAGDDTTADQVNMVITDIEIDQSSETGGKDDSTDNDRLLPINQTMEEDELEYCGDDDDEEEEAGIKINSAGEKHSHGMYICDLLIGDVFICQGLSGYKLQAMSCAARKAFSLLSKSNFLVGGVRSWYGGGGGGDGSVDNDDAHEPIDYLTLCLSPKADQVPLLTPFIADPLKPIPSDQPISPEDPAETFRVCNPKPLDELWLYTALPIAVNLETALTPEQYLAQSSEFSQMSVEFEVEFNSTSGVFRCFALVDGHRCGPPTRALSVTNARAQVAFKLLRRLKQTQPVVGLLLPPPDPDDGPCLPEDDSMHPLWGLTEASIVDSLMWGKHEKQFALPIEHLEAHCEILGNTSSSDKTDADFASSFFHSREHLEQYIQAYAASAVVAPLRIPLSTLPHSLWPLARLSAHAWGLLTRIEFDCPENLDTAFLLVCKRAPLPRLMRTLFERTEVGVFYLLSRGNLSDEALTKIGQSELLEEEDAGKTSPDLPLPGDSPQATAMMDLCDSDDPLTRMARAFRETAVKQEPTEDEGREVGTADLLLVSAELNQPSNAVEILDDLPRQLIPGIDF